MYPVNASHIDCNYHTNETGKEDSLGMCGNGKVISDYCIGLDKCRCASFERLVPRPPVKNCPECETDSEKVEGWIHTNPVQDANKLVNEFSTFVSSSKDFIPELPESLSFVKTLGMFSEPSEQVYALGQSLDEAKQIITGERQDSYGSPEDSFSIIAKYWNCYLSTIPGTKLINAKDVAHMMILFKIARCSGQSPHRDNYIDIQGYAAIAADRLIPGDSK